MRHAGAELEVTQARRAEGVGEAWVTRDGTKGLRRREYFDVRSAEHVLARVDGPRVGDRCSRQPSLLSPDEDQRNRHRSCRRACFRRGRHRRARRARHRILAFAGPRLRCGPRVDPGGLRVTLPPCLPQAWRPGAPRARVAPMLAPAWTEDSRSRATAIFRPSPRAAARRREAVVVHAAEDAGGVGEPPVPSAAPDPESSRARIGRPPARSRRPGTSQPASCSQRRGRRRRLAVR